MGQPSDFTFYISMTVRTGADAEMICRLSPSQRAQAILGVYRDSIRNRPSLYNRLLEFFSVQPERGLDPISTRILLDVTYDEAIQILMELERFGRLRQLGQRHMWLLVDSTPFDPTLLLAST